MRVRDTRESSTEGSDTFAFLFDGFDAADGALAREIIGYLWAEADMVATRLRPRVGRAAIKPSCREVWKTEFSCRASGPLEGVRGGAQIMLRGRMNCDARGARRLGGSAASSSSPGRRRCEPR